MMHLQREHETVKVPAIREAGLVHALLAGADGAEADQVGLDLAGVLAGV
jgi:hypothetical protein